MGYKHFLNEKEVDEILNQCAFKKGLDAYLDIMSRLKENDVSNDTEYFWRKYRGFFKMWRKNQLFCERYFAYLQNQIGNTKGVSFDDVFKTIFDFEERCEVSFSSKLLHCVNPNKPIWDSVVAGMHFGFWMPKDKDVDSKKRKCIDLYCLFEKQFNEYKESDEGKMLIEKFNDRFSNYIISDTKKIDFILWKHRN